MTLKKRICIINGNMKEDYSDGYVIGAEKYANELGYRTTVFSMLCSGMVDTNKEECVYSYINFDEYDGVLFIEHSFSEHKHVAREVEELLKESCKIPIVTIGSSDISEDCFALDSMNDFEAITDHLIMVHGCTRIYCLGGNRDHNNRRVDGFEKSIEKHGLNPDECVALYGGYWTDCAEKLAKDIACGNMEMPEAIVCVTDIVALARKIGTLETSILPYEDCCTVFTPKHPKTKPTLGQVLHAERKLDREALIADALENVEKIKVAYYDTDEM